MPRYVDGYVVPLAKNKLAAYRRMAAKACKIWLEHGAVDYVETALEDAKVPCGPGFTRGLKLKRGDTVVFAWIVYKSRAHRDRVNARVMKDPRITAMCDPKNPPFDVKQMIYGGFKVIVSA